MRVEGGRKREREREREIDLVNYLALMDSMDIKWFSTWFLKQHCTAWMKNSDKCMDFTQPPV